MKKRIRRGGMKVWRGEGEEEGRRVGREGEEVQRRGEV